MKAVSYASYGGPEVLEVSELPDPVVGPAEVLVRVRAAGVNPVDWKVMAGGLDSLMHAEFPIVPGWDVAGVVEKVGLDAGEFHVGDEVMAYARKDWLHAGTYAELVTVPVRMLACKPAGLAWEQAAGLPLAGLTAYQTLSRLHVRAGDTVLVHAAAGGVGSLAVQIARTLGARVIGTAGEANHAFLRSLGAEPVTYGDGLIDRVRALAPDGVDVVVDYVGGVLEQTKAVLAPKGRHASIADPAVAQAGGRYVWVRPDGGDLTELAGLVEAGKVTVPVEKTYPLEQAADAVRHSMGGHTRGKIVLTVGD